MRKLLLKLLNVTLLGALLSMIFAAPVIAVPASAAASLTVSNNIFIQDVQPGQTYLHKMTVTSGASGPMDIKVEAAGLGLSLNGGVQALSPQEDVSPYSARSFISDIDKPSFRLEPGTSEELQVTISIPVNASPGERYADIHIYSEPGEGDGVSVIISANVPVIANIPGATPVKTGRITGLSVPQSEAGQPVEVDTTFQNTGTARIQVKNTVTITDASGKIISQIETPLTQPSIIPTFSRMFAAMPAGLSVGLAPGQYLVESKVILDDATVLDTKSTSFDVIESSLKENREQGTPDNNYLLPGMDPDSLVIAGFNNQETPYVDAIAKADTEVTLIGSSGSGKIIIGKYSQKPQVSIQFSALPDDGGTGKRALKYIDVRVEGFSDGIARINVHYTDAEIEDIDPDSLFMSYFYGEKWENMQNMKVITADNMVVGEIPVSALNGTVIGLGSGLTVSALNNFENTPAPGISWSLAGAVIGGILVIGVIVIFVLRRKTT